jgi:hypothetical protein
MGDISMERRRMLGFETADDQRFLHKQVVLLLPQPFHGETEWFYRANI